MNYLLSLPHFWFGRLYVSAHAGVIALVACFADDTLLYRTVAATGPAGFWCVLALAFISVISMLDVLINDLMPERFKLCRIKRYRHYLLVAISIGACSVAVVIAKQVGISTLHASLALPVAGAFCLAVLDLYARKAES